MPWSVIKTQSKWCINKHGASKIINKFETYHPTSPLSHSLSSHSFSVVSLSSPKPTDGSSPTTEKCIKGGGRAWSPPLLLHRLSRIIVDDQASLHRTDFNRHRSAMSVSPQITLNPYILQLIYLFIVRRCALADMHSGSARVRVQSN
jgi:hypothetical protein